MFFFAAGNLGEISSIRARVPNRADYKISMQGFKHSARTPDPPLEAVLKTPFWSSAAFESIRARLAKAAPAISVLHGGTYITINTQTGTTSLNAQTIVEGEAQVCTVCELLTS